MNRCIAILVVAPFLLVAGTAAQQTSPAPGPSISTVPAATRNSLPDTPQILGTGAERYRVTAIKGLVNPWGLAFLPNGDILVTEKPGRLRIIRNGVLDPTPLGGLPVVNTRAVNAGLMDVALHPRYAENQYIYFTYSKPSANLQREDVRWDGQTRLKANGLRDVVNATLARARYDGGATLTDVRDIFIADAESQGTSGSRIAFAWSVTGGHVNYDTHADAPGISYHGYGKGRESTGENGTLVAAFDGSHGWFWRNRSGGAVTVSLRTEGGYTALKRVV